MNLPLTLAQARQYGVQSLKASSPSATIDAEYLLEKASGQPRLRFRSHPEAALSPSAWQAYKALIKRRARGEPVAYCLGQRGFMDFTLTVSPAVLIPRPETEHLITTALNYPGDQILDLGTGSGCVAIALARAWPQAQVDAVDQSAAALACAQQNAEQLGVEQIAFKQGHWYEPVNGHHYDLIVANPPYIADTEPHPDQDDARFEPRAALRAGPTGLEAITAIIDGAQNHLNTRGWMWLEHGYAQAQAVRDQLANAGFEAIATHCDLGGHERISGGQWNAAR